jgi:hypothetical protein
LQEFARTGRAGQFARISKNLQQEGGEEGRGEDAYRGWSAGQVVGAGGGDGEDGGVDVPDLLLSATAPLGDGGTRVTAPPLGDALLLLAAAFSSSRRRGTGAGAGRRHGS